MPQFVIFERFHGSMHVTVQEFLVDVSFSVRWFSKISKHIEHIWGRKPLVNIHILAVVSNPYSTISDRLNPQTVQKSTT